jgi:hypothetical protein
MSEHKPGGVGDVAAMSKSMGALPSSGAKGDDEIIFESKKISENASSLISKTDRFLQARSGTPRLADRAGGKSNSMSELAESKCDLPSIPVSPSEAVDWLVTYRGRSGRIFECQEGSEKPLVILFEDGETLRCDMTANALTFERKLDGSESAAANLRQSMERNPENFSSGLLSQLMSGMKARGLDPAATLANAIKTEPEQDEEESEDESEEESEEEDEDEDEETDEDDEDESDDEEELVRVKWVFGDEIRATEMSCSKCSYSSTKAKLDEEYSGSISMKYTDDEDDLVIIKSQDDLEAALAQHQRLHGEGSNKSLRIVLERSADSDSPGKALSRTAPAKRDGEIDSAGSKGVQAEQDGEGIQRGVRFDTQGGRRGERTLSYTAGGENGVSNKKAGGTTPRGTPKSKQGTASGALGEINWQRGDLLGRGSFGKVYAAINLRTGDWLAVKQVSFGRHSDGSKEVLAVS